MVQSALNGHLAIQIFLLLFGDGLLPFLHSDFQTLPLSIDDPALVKLRNVHLAERTLANPLPAFQTLIRNVLIKLDLSTGQLYNTPVRINHRFRFGFRLRWRRLCLLTFFFCVVIVWIALELIYHVNNKVE